MCVCHQSLGIHVYIRGGATVGSAVIDDVEAPSRGNRVAGVHVSS